MILLGWVRRWWVLIYGAAVLGFLAYAWAFDGATLPELLAIAVIFILVPLSWNVTWDLWRQWRANPEIGLLRANTLIALDVSVIVTIFAGVFLNNGMEHPILDPFATMVLTRVALLQLALPLLYWKWLYRNGRK